jgi:hypothetical protein
MPARLTLEQRREEQSREENNKKKKGLDGEDKEQSTVL